VSKPVATGVWGSTPFILKAAMISDETDAKGNDMAMAMRARLFMRQARC